MRGDPAHAKAREREDLGHAADRDALFVQVDDGFAPLVLLRQVAVDKSVKIEGFALKMMTFFKEAF